MSKCLPLVLSGPVTQMGTVETQEERHLSLWKKKNEDVGNWIRR